MKKKLLICTIIILSLSYTTPIICTQSSLSFAGTKQENAAAKTSNSFDEAEAYYNKKDYAKAIECYTQYIAFGNKKDKNIEVAHYKRGNSYRKLRNYSSAMEDVNMLLTKSKKNPYAYSLQSMILADMNKKEDATTTAEKVSKLIKNSKDCELFLNQVYVYSKIDAENAITDKALELYLSNAEFYANNNAEQLHDLCSYLAILHNNYIKKYNSASPYKFRLTNLSKKIIDLNPNDKFAQTVYSELSGKPTVSAKHPSVEKLLPVASNIPMLPIKTPTSNLAKGPVGESQVLQKVSYTAAPILANNKGKTNTTLLASERTNKNTNKTYNNIGTTKSKPVQTSNNNFVTTKYPQIPIIHGDGLERPFPSSISYTYELEARNAFDDAESYYKNGQYINAQRSLNKVLSRYGNSACILLFKSQIEDALGNNQTAIEYAGKALNLYKPATVGFYNDNPLYMWRAYLLIKQGNETNLSAIYKDLDSAGSFYDFQTHGHNPLIRKKRIEYYPVVWALMDDKRIPSTMKADIYKYFVKKTNHNDMAIIASYIQFIFSLNDSDPLFKKLGKTKQQILTLYLATLKNPYCSQIAKGIVKMASGNTKVGLDEIMTGLTTFNVDGVDKKEVTKHILAQVSDSLRILKPMQRKEDTYTVGAVIGVDGTNLYISRVLTPDVSGKGVQQGDKITKINGHSVSSYGNPYEVAKLLDGKQNTSVKVEIARIPGEITLNRTSHLQADVYDYFILPQSIKIMNQYIYVEPIVMYPSGMIYHKPYSKRCNDYCM